DDGQVGTLARLDRPDLAVEAERTGRAQGGELERLGCRERLRPWLARPGEEERGPELLEHVERGRRGGAVRAQADRHAGVEQLAERRDPATEHRVRARAVDDRDAVLGEERDLLV